MSFDSPAEIVSRFGQTFLQKQSASNHIRQCLPTRLLRLCYRAQVKPELMRFTNGQTQKGTRDVKKKVVSDSNLPTNHRYNTLQTMVSAMVSF